MSNRSIWFLLLTINVALAVGDACVKHASESGGWGYRAAGLSLWICACLLWFPLMHARGFTRLIALSDVVGVVMLVAIGRVFLGERLNAKESVGVVLALASAVLLGGR